MIFKITKPGLYKNRSGERCEIIRWNRNSNWPRIQIDPASQGFEITFTDLGRMFHAPETLSEHDIIAIWEEPQMTNKTKLQERADALQAELNLLKAEISKPQESEGAYGIFNPAKDEKYYQFAHDSNKGYEWKAETSKNFDGKAKSQFKTLEIADAYADAFNLFFRELPMCVGCVKPAERRNQYVIQPKEGSATEITIDFYNCNSLKLARLSPVFDTSANALAAMNKIGEARIMKAFKALKGEF